MNQTKQKLMSLLAMVSTLCSSAPVTTKTRRSHHPSRRMRTTEELLAEIDRKKEQRRLELLKREVGR